jgi:hypothetical protein
MKAKDKKNIAFELYISGKLQKEIAELLDVHEVTVSKWVRDDNWDDIRSSLLGGGYRIVAMIYKRVLKDLEDNPDTFNLDQISKAASAIKTFQPKGSLNLENYNRAFQDLLAWMAQNGHSDLLETVMQVQDQFIDSYIDKNK